MCAWNTKVTLAADAAYLGAEILCFGRTASGETFTTGAVSQRTSIRRGGKLVWFEQGRLQAEAGAMQGRWRWTDRPSAARSSPWAMAWMPPCWAACARPSARCNWKGAAAPP
jgi:hypothetical protein